MLSPKKSLSILKRTNALLEGHFVLSSGLQYFPVPNEVSKEMWNVCNDEQELVETISNFEMKRLTSKDYYKKIGIKTKVNYFEKVNSSNVSNFIGNQ